MLGLVQRKAMMDDQIRTSKDHYEFLVSLNRSGRQWDDFLEKDSPWKFYLTRDGRSTIEPSEIGKVKKDRTLYETFCPFVTRWPSIYTFRFRKQDDIQSPRSVELILMSPPGSAALKGDLYEPTGTYYT
jgi:hypothetical protein